MRSRQRPDGVEAAQAHVFCNVVTSRVKGCLGNFEFVGRFGGGIAEGLVIVTGSPLLSFRLGFFPFSPSSLPSMLVSDGSYNAATNYRTATVELWTFDQVLEVTFQIPNCPKDESSFRSETGGLFVGQHLLGITMPFLSF